LDRDQLLGAVLGQCVASGQGWSENAPQSAKNAGNLTLRAVKRNLGRAAPATFRSPIRVWRSWLHVFLETERLLLRRFTHDDVDELYDLDGDPEVMRYITGGATTPREEVEHVFLPAFMSYYDRYDGYGFWAAIDKATGRFLGWFHLRPQDGDPVDQPELGYRLRREVWGAGYASEGARALVHKAFTDLGAERVVAMAFRENLASRRVMEKVGMTLARAYRLTPDQMVEMLGITCPELFDGEVVEYAITKSAWEAQHRGVG
jgi:RimJ/RimL family protein N-acetyltransferase